MEQPKKKNKEPKIETPTIEIAPKAELTLKEEVIELMTKIAMISKGNREIDLAVDEAFKLLDQVKSLASFIEKAQKYKK